ncbi:MAG: TetR/AcrR family transcriptional regulator C-terminal ligand-binding domain-containing protein [Actinomycetota bacterium]
MTTTRPVGRPPGPHEDTLAKILPVALRLFLDEGGAALTPTRLHQETGVARATIYRNWPDAADLIEVMLSRATQPPPDDLFTGELHADLHAAAEFLVWRFTDRPARAFFGACLDSARHNERVAAAAESFIAGILDPFRSVITDAVERGELDGDVEQMVSEIAGPLILDHVVLGRTVTTARARQIVDNVLSYSTKS